MPHSINGVTFSNCWNINDLGDVVPVAILPDEAENYARKVPAAGLDAWRTEKTTSLARKQEARS